MKTNVLHVHFTQAFGICAAASAILSYMALGFRDSGDKKAVLLSRAVVIYFEVDNFRMHTTKGLQ